MPQFFLAHKPIISVSLNYLNHFYSAKQNTLNLLVLVKIFNFSGSDIPFVFLCIKQTTCSQIWIQDRGTTKQMKVIILLMTPKKFI